MIEIQVKQVPEIVDIQVDDKIKVNNLDYDSLKNKPQLNSVTLKGNKTFEEIGINPISNIELLNLLK